MALLFVLVSNLSGFSPLNDCMDRRSGEGGQLVHGVRRACYWTVVFASSNDMFRVHSSQVYCILSNALRHNAVKRG